eukprot:g26318.t1
MKENAGLLLNGNPRSSLQRRTRATETSVTLSSLQTRTNAAKASDRASRPTMSIVRWHAMPQKKVVSGMKECKNKAAPFQLFSRCFTSEDLLSTIAEFEWQGLVTLRATCSHFNNHFDYVKLNRIICLGFASAGLYVPFKYHPGYARLLFDHILPSRHKWSQVQESRQDFKIQVCVRFKPLSHAEAKSNSFVLPLHQRIRLVREGKIKQLDLLNTSDGGEVMRKLLAEQGGLSPELMAALLEAQNLELYSATARVEESQTTPLENKSYSFAEHALAAPTPHGVQVEGPAASDSEDDAPGAHSLHQPHPAEGSDDSGVSSWPRSGTPRASAPQRQESVRKRMGQVQVLAVEPTRAVMHIPGQGVKPFPFPRVFNAHDMQSTVYEEAARDAVIALLNGYNAAVLCYGQTGSGKTHTMFGPPSVWEVSTEARFQQCGMVLRALSEIFEARGSERLQGVDCSVTLQYVDIYNESIHCLGSGQAVDLRCARDGSFVMQGAQEYVVHSLAEAIDVLLEGEKRKKFAATAMNDRSSRSHTVLVVSVQQVLGSRVSLSRLHLVDLAGSERLHQSGVTERRKEEAIGINYSLYVLGKCINALAKGKGHVPYLESSLTKLLKGALGGNSRTSILVTCSEEDKMAEQTLNTLQFGLRCCAISNSTQLSSTSVSQALEAIDTAIQHCSLRIQAMERTGKSGTALCSQLRYRCQQLRQRQKDLKDRQVYSYEAQQEY